MILMYFDLMKRIYSVLSSLAIVGCLVLNNYSTYTVITAPWRAAGHPVPSHLGMNATFPMAIFGGLLTGCVFALIIGGLSRFISRFTSDKKEWSRRLYLGFAILFSGYTLSINGNSTILLSSDDERLEKLRSSGVIEALEGQGFYEK